MLLLKHISRGATSSQNSLLARAVFRICYHAETRNAPIKSPLRLMAGDVYIPTVHCDKAHVGRPLSRLRFVQ